MFKKILKAFGKSIPFVGDVITNIDSENGTKIGNINVIELGYAILRIFLLLSLIKGWLSLEEIAGFLGTLK